MKKKVRVVGAGLAGSEAAFQLANLSYDVELVEMRPVKMTPAHTSSNFAELVCSNSFRSDNPSNAVGLLKEEMRSLDSLIIKTAEEHKLPAGSALAVDRESFSQAISDKIKAHPKITIVSKEFTEFDDIPTIVATGPLTSDKFSKYLQEFLGQEDLYFYDAIAPIVSVDNINFDIAYKKSRYDKGEGDDYINCPMNRKEFMNFYTEILKSEQAPMRDFEDVKLFEGCMPIEAMASRGMNTMLFGPLKPVGLEQAGIKRPHAVVQLRQDDAAASLYNLVGFQTRLKWGDQKRVIQMIPGLENVEIVRYGVMHRNTYIKSPLILNANFQVIEHPEIFFAGQVSGVEGYVESAASGLYAALSLHQQLQGKKPLSLSRETMLGALGHYIANANPNRFQPMNVNYGLIEKRLEDKDEMVRRSLMELEQYKQAISK